MVEILVDDEDYEELNKYKWFITRKGYVSRMEKNEFNEFKITISMHRFIMNAPEGMVVDHINHNRQDNRKSNLRICTAAENTRNIGVNRRNKSGVTGVLWRDTNKRWVARITIEGKEIFLGSFINFEDAVSVRKQAESVYFGEFKNNYVEINEIKINESKEKKTDAIPVQINNVLPYHNTTGVKGVCWCKNANKWKSYIGVKGKTHILGYFHEFEEAVKARKDFEQKYFSDFYKEAK